MGLGTKKIKADMRGTGGGRWMPRADAKRAARKERRARSKKEAGEKGSRGEPF